MIKYNNHYILSSFDFYFLFTYQWRQELVCAVISKPSETIGITSRTTLFLFSSSCTLVLILSSHPINCCTWIEHYCWNACHPHRAYLGKLFQVSVHRHANSQTAVFNSLNVTRLMLLIIITKKYVQHIFLAKWWTYLR